MASKRKSTVPCMIPSKSKHMREDIILGCLPELLPTIPEDSILSISSKGEETQRFHDFSKAEPKTSCWERGTYSCPLCSFESGDLNLFLHHMDNCHMDFHAQPNFYCLSCKVSAVKFEGLALHNAKSHPELHSVHKRVSLQVTKRDGAITVEQTLFTEADLSESGISITKTPIMKMTKGGHKKIVVSHTVEVQRAEPSIDKPATVTNGTQGISWSPEEIEDTLVQTPQVNIHHAVITKETGKELSCRTAENCKIAGRGGSVSNHGHTGKGCSSSIKTSVSCLPGIPKSQNSSYIEGSIM
uniref:Si:ch211-232b12.5 n=1 Tax=Sinocyclocheilus anshuiensis TaxID=1608454 RepID=A0A671P3D3_9TELE